MDLIIKTYKSVGNVYLNESRYEVRKKLNSIYDEFKKTPLDQNTTDFFIETGLLVYYDENDLCEAVEIVLPANPIFNNINLLNIPYVECVKYFEKLDNLVLEDDFGFTSEKFGIGVYAPDKDLNPLCLPESVIVFKKGYYDG